jgi:hypothetical protein
MSHMAKAKVWASVEDGKDPQVDENDDFGDEGTFPSWLSLFYFFLQSHSFRFSFFLACT